MEQIQIILVNIEISIIQTVIFEFENMMHLFMISLQKKHFSLSMRTFPIKKNTQNGQIQNNVQICCSAISIKKGKKYLKNNNNNLN